MNFKLRLNSFYIPCHTLTLALFFFLFFGMGCRGKQDDPKEPARADSNRVSWNILFPPGTDSNNRARIVGSIRGYVNNFYSNYNKERKTDYKANIEPVIFCNCDTLLYNFSFLPVDGEGKSVSTAPSNPPPTPSGELVSTNTPVSDSLKNNPESKKSEAFRLNKAGTDDSKILAIIDSGLDSTKFPAAFRNLIWRDPSAPTLHNFIPGENKFNMFDGTSVKHGSAVAAIIVRAMENAPRYSKLMILKALSDDNVGSIFSISCALSYAVKKNATVVNLSLGYYGTPDIILHHYLELGQQHKPAIEMFAAAGNTRDAHNDPLCKSGFNNNELGKTLFYPACFTSDLTNVTSVTQLNQINSSCYYQNYSNQYISLGIYDSINCCQMPAYFYKSTDYYEGSSFATPVASGLRMGGLLSMPPVTTSKDPSKKVTIDGKYISYSPNP